MRTSSVNAFVIWPFSESPERWWGLGARHTLLSRMLTFGAQFHPSSGLGCQFPDATLVSKDDCYSSSTPQRGRPVVSPHGRLGETSWPEIRQPAGSFLSDRDWKPLRFFGDSSPCPRSASLPCGRRSLASGDGSCLLTLELLFFFSGGRPLGLPLIRSLLLPTGSSPICDRRLPWGHSLRGALSLFPTPVATPERSGGWLKSSFTAGTGLSPHWLAVATYGL